MSSSLSPLFASAEEQLRELPMSPLAFGALAFVGFLALLGVLWFFRGVAAEGRGRAAARTASTATTDHQGSHH